jgi:phosphoglycolate phosphatase-like HAD superfamily hydrolase
MHNLILWDVDATLLQTQGLSGQAMRAAIGQVFTDVPERERTFFSGKTDWQIICDCFPDLSPDAIGEKLAHFKEAYVAEFQRRYDELREKTYALPGVFSLLRSFQERGIAQVPLTGNIAPIARMKLDLLGMLDYLNVEAGAYGDDHYDRLQLVPIAAKRAAHYYGYPFAGREIVVIGDTPNDIRCGKASGTRTVAVETGPYKADDLRPYEPDAILPDLSNFGRAVAAILGNDK